MSDRPRESTPSFDMPVALLVDGVCDHFENAWRRGERPVLRQYLDGVSAAVLPELLRLDVHYRREAGEHPEAADYRDQVPEHLELVERFFAQARTITFTGEPGATGPETVDDGGAKSARGDAAFEVSPDLPQKETTPHTAIPGYEILGELGRGGMGVVYKARHIAFDRVVALKMILNSEYADEAELARFRVEAEAVARLQHPGIVQVFEGGEHEGTPFLSLEYVDGGNLGSAIKGEPQPAKHAAEIVEQLARAMHHAHEQGVIHRDLKPGNVLLTASGTPKVTDFGLAKKLDAAHNLSQTGAIMGTPSYMAPEQALGLVKQIGPAADVYALGAILYELLTGRPPFKGATLLDTLAQVRNDEPVPPSRLVGRVPADLETVCLKCLQKEPGRRYDSALSLAEDLRRFRAQEPIAARPVGRIERTWRWCRRNPAVASLTLAVALTLLGGAATATWFAVAADKAAKNAEQKAKAAEAASVREAARADSESRAKSEAEKQTELVRREKQKQLDHSNMTIYAFQLIAVQHELAKGDLEKARQLLGQCDRKHCAWEHKFLLKQTHKLRLDKLAHTSGISSVCFSPDGQRILSASEDKAVKVWDARGREGPTLRGHTGEVWSVCFSADGKRILSGSADETIRVWDAKTGKEALTLTGHTGSVTSVCFSGDGQRILSGSEDQTVRVWEAQTGKQIQTLTGHTGAILSVCFSPDGKRILSGSEDHTVKVWDAQNGRQLHTLKGHTWHVNSVCFSSDGQRILSGSVDQTVKVWDSQSGAEALSLKGHTGSVYSASFSPDGKRIVSGSGDLSVKVWDAHTGQQTLTLKGHAKEVTSVCFSPDGQRILSGSGDRTLKLWDALTGQDALTLTGHTWAVMSVCFSPDGRHILSGGADLTVKLWDGQSGQQVRTLQGHTHLVSSVFFSSDGRRILSGSADKTAKVWDAQSGEETLTLTGHTGPVWSVCFSPDATCILSGSFDHTVKVWEAQSGQELLTLTGHTGPVFSVCYSPDGQRILSGSADLTVKVWDAQNGKELRTLRGHTKQVASVCYSGDGKRIFSGSADKTVKVWDAQTGEEVLTLQGHTGEVTSVCLSPDGKRIVSASRDKTLKVWDAQTGQEVLTLQGHAEEFTSVCLSPDGNRIVSASRDKTVRLWEGHAGRFLHER